MGNEKLHQAELKIAKYFVDVCEKNNLTYYMMGGTLLGAVRHKGFIPWDDDMDFGMPREDYEKLVSYLNNNPSDQYNLCTFLEDTNEDYPIKIESSELTLIDKSTGIERTRNVWIDIFPIDGMPDNSLMKYVHKLKLLVLRAFFKLSQLSGNVSEVNYSRTNIEKIIIKVGKVINIEKRLDSKKLYLKLDKALKEYSFDSSQSVVNFMGAYKFKEMFPKKIYENTQYYEFENTAFIGPENFDYVLTQMYGNYNEIPKDSEKNKHHIYLNDSVE